MSDNIHPFNRSTQTQPPEDGPTKGHYKLFVKGVEAPYEAYGYLALGSYFVSITETPSKPILMIPYEQIDRVTAVHDVVTVGSA